MPKMIQIRDVPDNVHRTLKSRAAREGMSLSNYIKNMLRDSTSQLTMQEWFDRVATRKTIPKKESVTQIIRGLRDSG